MTGETLQKIFANIEPADKRIIIGEGKALTAVFSADNGISKNNQSRTYDETINYLDQNKEGTVLVTDVGGAQDYPDELITLDPIVHNCSDGICRQTISEQIVLRKIAYGCADISEGPAMSEGDACKAIYIGLEAAKAASNAGYRIVTISEVGTGNEITGAAVLAALTGELPEEKEEREIAESAIERIEKKDNEFDQTVEILRQAGGYSIAAMTGAFLGAALYGLDSIFDGDVSEAAALCACRINPLVKDYVMKGE